MLTWFAFAVIWFLILPLLDPDPWMRFLLRLGAMVLLLALLLVLYGLALLLG